MEAIEFYKSVSVTNPKYVKKAKLNGIMVDTIDPMYQQEEATKAFKGLYGSSWGIKDAKFSTRTIGTTEVMTLNAVFYYPGGEFEYAVSAKSVYISTKGFEMIDVDVEKKLFTSFKSKCLSLLGFNSDIFLNKFNDVDYVNEAFAAYELCSPEQQQKLRKGLGYYQVDASKINSHFGIATLSELLAKDYNEAEALIVSLSTRKKEETK